MVRCMFCNEKLLLLGTSSTMNILIHSEYKPCFFKIKNVKYKPGIFHYLHSTEFTRSEYFYYKDICFYFEYNDDYVKLFFDKNDYGCKILDIEFLRESFNISLVDKALDKVIENLIFI